ncbi:MAG: enoyl-CoA hydratase/isomerase family protein [Rhodospirillales bacterium]|nr:enoyl-CoA hydratase/isomerase family protein [Rhodospirillales bacterium]
MSDAVLYEMKGQVAVITINQPDRRNALGIAVRQGLWDAWDRFEKDSEAKVAILTGTGEKAFCAGMDLKEMSATTLRIPPRGLVPVIGDNVVVTKPTIAAVNGVAFAGGFLISQMCDLCVAADHATFGITEAKVGRGSPWATPLIHMLPQRVMMEILLTAAPVGAQRLYDLGYVNKVVPLADLLDEALKMANMIAANAPLTVQACRRSVYMATEMGRSAALEAARAAFDSAYLSEDAQEGPKAFAEKRAPVWKGR